MDIVLSLVALTAFGLVVGAIFFWRRGERRQVWLLLLLAMVLVVNLLIWTVPAGDGTAPVERVAEIAG
jgi:uncharacterized membrane protein